MNVIPTDASDANLELLLNRNDIWRGQSRGVASQFVKDSGYPEVNAALLNGGWPKRSLVEVCQKGLQQQEWLLFAPCVKRSAGYIVLLNPPLLPFAQAFIQLGVDIEKIIVVQVSTKADFLASFVELARTESCEALLAWQQNHMFSYTELRKCLLAANEGPALCVLFRPESAQQQSSPAILRLVTMITATHMQVTFFKQKGALQKTPLKPIQLALPPAWKGLLPYHLLDQAVVPGESKTPAYIADSAAMPLTRGKK